MIIFFKIIWIESLKEQHLFEMEIFYNIKHVFTSYYFWTAVYKYAIWTFFKFYLRKYTVHIQTLLFVWVSWHVHYTLHL